jgi:hypothetical protein
MGLSLVLACIMQLLPRGLELQDDPVKGTWLETGLARRRDGTGFALAAARAAFCWTVERAMLWVWWGLVGEQRWEVPRVCRAG